MTEFDKPAFATMMVAVGELFNRPLSDVVLELQFTALADLPLEDIRRAVTMLIRTKPFFPAPAEIRDAITGPVADRAELAWIGMVRLVRERGWNNPPTPKDWPDAATRRAALELYGGWSRLCECLPASGPEFLGMAKQFKAAFCAYDRRDASETTLPPSRDEARVLLHDLKRRLKGPR